MRTKMRSSERFRLVKGFPYGARPPHPINIKIHGRLRDNHNRIDQLHFYLFIFLSLYLTFPTLSCCSSGLHGIWGHSRWPRVPPRCVRPDGVPTGRAFVRLPLGSLTIDLTSHPHQSDWTPFCKYQRKILILLGNFIFENTQWARSWAALSREDLTVWK
jgi:hypothetical protein